MYLLSDARVMWDQNTGRSRGYGFVAFVEKADAERAMSDMKGVWLGNRAIRCNWGNQKSNSANYSNSSSRSNASNYSDVTNQSTSNNTTVYVGNLPTNIADSVLLYVSLQGLYSLLIDLLVGQHSKTMELLMRFVFKRGKVMGLLSFKLMNKLQELLLLPMKLPLRADQFV